MTPEDVKKLWAKYPGHPKYTSCAYCWNNKCQTCRDRETERQNSLLFGDGTLTLSQISGLCRWPNEKRFKPAWKAA